MLIINKIDLVDIYIKKLSEVVVIKFLVKIGEGVD